jgi:peptidoglycan/xylan/chitin deacetylase (PgdA/CDA1 family)
MTLPKANGPIWPWDNDPQSAATKDDINSLTTQLAESVSQVNGDLSIKPLSKGMVTFIFDDANPSAYTVAYPIFNAKSLKACLAYPVSVIWNQNGITLQQSYEMQNNGWEIMSHSTDHVKITDSFTQEKINYDLIESKKFLNNYGLSAKQFVAPMSSYPTGTMAPYFNDTLAKQYDAAYLDGTDFSDPAYANNANPINIYKIKRANMQNATLAQLKAAVDYAEANKTWLVFYEHQIDVAGYTTSQTLSDLLDYIKTKNIDVVTGTEAISKISTKLIAKENPNLLNKRILNLEAKSGNENILVNADFNGVSTPAAWTYNEAGVTGGKSHSIVAGVPANSLQVVLDGTNTGVNEHVDLYQDYPISALLDPTPFVFSVYAKATGNNAKVKLVVVPMNGASQWSTHYESKEFNLTTYHTKVELAVLIPNYYAPITALRVYIMFINGVANNAITFTANRPKLEIGTQSSAWNKGKKFVDYFSVDMAASQAINSSAWTKVGLARNLDNPYGSFDTANSKFVTSVKGLYQFNANVTFSTGTEGSRIIVALYKNGSNYMQCDQAGSGTAQQGISFSVLANANPGDYFELYVWQNTGTTQNLGGGLCWLNGLLVA